MTYRSVLFVPAANTKAMAKAPALGADAIIIDLEDALAPEQKDQGRAAAISFLRQNRELQTPIAVRINTEPAAIQMTDIMAISGEGASALVIPKVESVQDLQQVESQVKRVLRPYQQQSPALWAMIETPLGILNLPEIAEGGRAFRLDCLIAGTNDLTTQLQCSPDNQRTALQSHLAEIVLVGRAFSLSVFDGVYNDFSDERGFTEQAKQGKDLGFDGKTLIHPAQIEPANTVFGASLDEIKQATAIVRAFGYKKNAGKGAINIGGQMVERLHLAAAEKLLAQQTVKKTK
ncbi:MAG: CoA ester lyase [Robiginitomaculum sp.]|nr:CoA ester lyase [Robiginitomaculum sp.]